MQFFLVLFYALPLRADGTTLIPLPNQKPITLFEVEGDSKDISVREEQGLQRVYLKIKGKIKVENTTLLLNVRPLKFNFDKIVVGEDGEFEASVPIRAERVDFQITGVDPHGKTEQLWYRVHVTNWIVLVAPEREAMGSNLSVGTGVSLINYQDTRITPFSEKAVFGKISYAREINRKKMNIGANLFATLLPFSKSRESDARFIGINLRAGYLVPFAKYPWSLSLMGGIYYTTMMVSTNDFGFKNMSGPQFYPTLRYAISKTRAIATYAKYSPIGQNFSLLGLSNREIAAGISYSTKLKNNHQLSFSLDYANIDLTIELVQIKTSSVNFGISYSL